MKKKIVVGIVSLALGLSVFLPVVNAATTTRPNPIMQPYTAVGTYDSTYKVNINPFTINKLTSEADDPYYYNFRISPPIEQVLAPHAPITLDKNGFPMITVNGVNYYHPVATAQHAIYYMEAYQQLGNPAYLDQAKSLANHLASLSITPPDKSMYFAYHFPYWVQGTEPINSLWYSSMSQGQALSVFSRLYAITHEARYLDYANRTMRSLMKTTTTLPGPKPWVTNVDSYHYLWFEEYPTETTKPVHVFNGFMFTMFGLYDYYKLTSSTTAKTYLQATMSTVLTYGDRYRLPGDYSYYSLKYNKPATDSYHSIHIRQLNMLYKITGDVRFKDMSDRFYADTHPTTTSVNSLSSGFDQGMNTLFSQLYNVTGYTTFKSWSTHFVSPSVKPVDHPNGFTEQQIQMMLNQ